MSAHSVASEFAGIVAVVLFIVLSATCLVRAFRSQGTERIRFGIAAILTFAAAGAIVAFDVQFR